MWFNKQIKDVPSLKRGDKLVCTRGHKTNRDNWHSAGDVIRVSSVHHSTVSAEILRFDNEFQMFDENELIAYWRKL